MRLNESPRRSERAFPSSCIRIFRPTVPPSHRPTDTMAHVVQVNVSNGGVPKRPVAEALVGPLGIATDAVRYTKVHGGPERAVCLYSLDVIEALRAEGHPIAPGTAGENLTLAGVDWPRLEAGAVVAVGGEVRLQLTTRVEPCKTIRASFAGGDFRRIQPARFPAETRWYTRVLSGGTVRPGDAVAVEAPAATGAAVTASTVDAVQPVAVAVPLATSGTAPAAGR